MPKDADNTTGNDAGTISRRSFLGQAAAASVLPLSIGQATPMKAATPRASTFLDILRPPDRATAYARLDAPLKLDRSGDEWREAGVSLDIKASAKEVSITLSAPAVALRYIHLRWQMPVLSSLLTLGDAWERSYGDLGWRNLIPERVMPWYFATHDGRAFHSYGVKTAANSLCFWQLDDSGVSLWLNVSNGGSGVQLGQRSLLAATIVSREGQHDEDGFEALHAFCKQMCSKPALAFAPTFGTNDWYYAYGKNSAAQTLKDAELVSDLAGLNSIRPFAVIDEGWADGSATFPSMAGLAAGVKERKVRPGIWIRPLRTKAGTDSRLLITDARFGERKDRAAERALDPTVPEARALAIAKVTEVSNWGYELIKHDFSTYDLLGQWGFEMGADPTLPGWSLHDRTRTNAEVLLDLYTGIREAAGPDRLILGCNTVGHLAQGLFDISRTGDDTSGRVWERTRRMGINTLAFRLPQHGAFFLQDADCVGITPGIPWEKNRQWMDVLARSGTALFISPGEGARTPEHQETIRDAFQIAAAGGTAAKPATWLQESTPQEWQANSKTLKYDWCSPDGAFPYTGDGN
jgi:alpha-galactosidase